VIRILQLGIHKIEFKHTTELIFDEDTTRYDFKNKSKSFSLILDDKKQNHQTILNWLKGGTLYEADVSGALCKLVKPGDTVVDIGANIGFHTFLLSALVEEKGTVISYEPGVDTVLELEQNKELNKARHVEIKQKILGESGAGEVFFHLSKTDSGTSYAVKHKDDMDLEWQQMTTNCLDDELNEFKNIKLVKIDVEGFEGNILRGSERTLKRKAVKYWIVEYASHCLARNGDDLETLMLLMEKHGYQMFVLDGHGGFPKLWPRKLHMYSRFIPNLLFADIAELASDWKIDDITKFISPPHLW